MKKTLLYSLAILFLALSGCMEDAEVWDSSVLDLSGDWLVKYSDDSGYSSGYTDLLTFNTAEDNGEEFWITDDASWWTYQAKVPVNHENLTFGRETAVPSSVDGYEIEVIILNGKVLKSASLQPSGYMADSIYFEIEFSDEPGNIYKAGGFRKTGFQEDPH